MLEIEGRINNQILGVRQLSIADDKVCFFANQLTRPLANSWGEQLPLLSNTIILPQIKDW